MRPATEKWRPFSPVDKNAFIDYKDEIALRNLYALRQIGFVGMLICALLFALSLPPWRVLGMTSSYATLLIVFAAIYLLCMLGMKQSKRLVLPLFYAAGMIMFLMASVMGTYLGQGSNATTILLVVVAWPQLIIDRPWRLHGFMVIMCAIFCVMDALIKQNGALMRLDIVNCIVFCIISAAISRQGISTKVLDITIKHELKQRSDMDTLTQLNNRSLFERTVTQYVGQSDRNAVLLIIDIDNFKAVNDTLGHQSGDGLLQRVGQCLRSTFRSGDTVSRLGGDEFIAFLPAVTDIGVIKDRVDAMLEQISEISLSDEVECPVSASAGMARYPQDGVSFDQLYAQADMALYHAKRAGKGVCVTCDALIKDEKRI